MFQLAIRTGAIIGGATDEQLEKITIFAKNFGIAFQIADDILDETSTFEKMGKTLGKDKAEGKLTYVSLYGLDGAKCKLSCLADECRDIIKALNIKSEIYEDIISKLVKGAGI